MKRLLFIAFAFLSAYAHGQDSFAPMQANNKALSVGLEGLVASKSAFFTYGFGASVKGELPLGESFSLSATGGLNKFNVKAAYKSPTGSTPLVTFIPIKVGAKYFIGGLVYTEGELGATIETNYEKKKYFNLTAGIGYIIPLTPHTGIDLSLRYEDWGDQAVKFGALRVAFRADWL